MANIKTQVPENPYAEFPLFPHGVGQRARKIRGTTWYSGSWADHKAALQKYLDEVDEIQAGRVPRKTGVVPDEYPEWTSGNFDADCFQLLTLYRLGESADADVPKAFRYVLADPVKIRFHSGEQSLEDLPEVSGILFDDIRRDAMFFLESWIRQAERVGLSKETLTISERPKSNSAAAVLGATESTEVSPRVVILQFLRQRPKDSFPAESAIWDAIKATRYTREELQAAVDALELRGFVECVLPEHQWPVEEYRDINDGISQIGRATPVMRVASEYHGIAALARYAA